MIKTTTETEGIKQTRAADCKWIWLHKELVPIWCSTLIALKILKSAHQAGNQPLLCRAVLCRNTFRAGVKVHNNVRWVRRTRGIHEWPLTEATLLKDHADWTQQVWKVVLWGRGGNRSVWFKGCVFTELPLDETDSNMLGLRLFIGEAKHPSKDNGSNWDSWELCFSVFTHIKLWIHHGKIYVL